MDLKKVYHDSEGNECNIFQMVMREPGWAANRIQMGEKAEARLKEISQQSNSPDQNSCDTCGGSGEILCHDIPVPCGDCLGR